MANVVGFVEAPGLGLDLPLDVRGTAFQQRVWQALREIPAGRTAVLRDRRSHRGAQGGSGGGAVCANALAVAIPCHRVVRTDRSLSGYSAGESSGSGRLSSEKRCIAGEFPVCGGCGKPFARRQPVAAPIDSGHLPDYGFCPPMLTRQKLFGFRILLYAVLAIATSLDERVSAGGKRGGRRDCAPEKGSAGASCQDCHGFAGTFRDIAVSRCQRSDDPRIHPSRHQQRGNDGPRFGTRLGRRRKPPMSRRTSLSRLRRRRPHRFSLPTPTAAPSAVMFPTTAVGATSAADRGSSVRTVLAQPSPLEIRR